MFTGDVTDAWLLNFGQGGQSSLNYDASAGGYFKYTPTSLGLSGYKAISTANIPDTAVPIKNPKQFFDVLTYTGNGSSQSMTGLGFQPDLVWIKNRTNNASWS